MTLPPTILPPVKPSITDDGMRADGQPLDDLTIKPRVVDNQHNSLTLGDLHGNTLKLLHFLVKYGIVEIKDKDYQDFYRSYTTHSNLLAKNDLTQQDDATAKRSFKTVQAIIKRLIIKPNSPFLHLLGDELADRGGNDYFMLLLLNQLHRANVQYVIYQSNHTLEFSLSYERSTWDQNHQIGQRLLLNANHCPSMLNMSRCFAAGMIKADELDALVSTHKQHQRLVGYTLREDGISLLSHAPIDLSVIKQAAKALETPFFVDSPLELALSIELVNAAYLEHVENNTLDQILNFQVLQQGYDVVPINPRTHPLEYIFWNRNYHQLNRLAVHPQGYSLNYKHGHDSKDGHADQPHIQSLDSEFGKYGGADNQCGAFEYLDKGTKQYRYIEVRNPVHREDGKQLFIGLSNTDRQWLLEQYAQLFDAKSRLTKDEYNSQMQTLLSFGESWALTPGGEAITRPDKAVQRDNYQQAFGVVMAAARQRRAERQQRAEQERRARQEQQAEQTRITKLEQHCESLQRICQDYIDSLPANSDQVQIMQQLKDGLANTDTLVDSRLNTFKGALKEHKDSLSKEHSAWHTFWTKLKIIWGKMRACCTGKETRPLLFRGNYQTFFTKQLEQASNLELEQQPGGPRGAA